jgi:hypothetical protein
MEAAGPHGVCQTFKFVPEEVHHGSRTSPYRHTRRRRHLVHSRNPAGPRRDAARSGPSGLSRRSLERGSRWNTVLGECSDYGAWGSPGSCPNGPSLRAQAPTEARALTKVGARTARLTHSRQGLCRPARTAEVTVERCAWRARTITDPAPSVPGASNEQPAGGLSCNGTYAPTSPACPSGVRI